MIFLRCVDFLCYICASSRFGASLGAVSCGVLRKFGFLLFPLQSCVKVEGFADKACLQQVGEKTFGLVCNRVKIRYIIQGFADNKLLAVS